MASLFPRRSTDGLASFSVDDQTGCAGCCDIGVDWIADRLLDYLLALALEIPGGGDCRVTHCATADRAGFLCPGRSRAAQPNRSLVGSSHQRPIGLCEIGRAHV